MKVRVPGQVVPKSLSLAGVFNQHLHLLDRGLNIPYNKYSSITVPTLIWSSIDYALQILAFNILWATFESTSPKEASTRGTDGHSTFWPTICVIFCRNVCHRLLSWSSSMAVVSKAFTPLPQESDRSDAEVSECHQSPMQRFGKCLQRGKAQCARCPFEIDFTSGTPSAHFSEQTYSFLAVSICAIGYNLGPALYMPVMDKETR